MPVKMNPKNKNKNPQLGITCSEIRADTLQAHKKHQNKPNYNVKHITFTGINDTSAVSVNPSRLGNSRAHDHLSK